LPRSGFFLKGFEIGLHTRSIVSSGTSAIACLACTMAAAAEDRLASLRPPESMRVGLDEPADFSACGRDMCLYLVRRDARRHASLDAVDDIIEPAAPPLEPENRGAIRPPRIHVSAAAL